MGWKWFVSFVLSLLFIVKEKKSESPSLSIYHPSLFFSVCHRKKFHIPWILASSKRETTRWIWLWESSAPPLHPCSEAGRTNVQHQWSGSGHTLVRAWGKSFEAPQLCSNTKSAASISFDSKPLSAMVWHHNGSGNVSNTNCTTEKPSVVQAQELWTQPETSFCQVPRPKKRGGFKHQRPQFEQRWDRWALQAD